MIYLTINPFETDIDKLERIILAAFEGECRNQILKACALSREIHRDQRYKEPDKPYIPHTFRVPAYLVVDFGVTDKDLIISGLLHDSIEDQPERLGKMITAPDTLDTIDRAKMALETLFSKRVAEIVWKLSNPLIYYEANTVDEKIQIYQANLSEELKDDAVYCVKLADLCDNWPTVNDNVSKERKIYAAKKYVDSFDKFIAGLSGNRYISSEKKHSIERYLQTGKSTLLEILD